MLSETDSMFNVKHLGEFHAQNLEYTRKFAGGSRVRSHRQSHHK